MLMAKVKTSILDGKEPFRGILVASHDFFFAHSFGQDGYDEGELDGFTVLPVELTIERPARSYDVFAAASAVGVEADSETDGPSSLIADPKIAARLSELGFDGYADSEVIGNMEREVRTVWSLKGVRFQVEPADVADFSVAEGEHAGFALKAETVRGRRRAHEAMWRHATPEDLAYATIFGELGVLEGFAFDGEKATAPDGREFVTERFAVDHLIDHGYLPFTEMAPSLRPA